MAQTHTCRLLKTHRHKKTQLTNTHDQRQRSHSGLHEGVPHSHGVHRERPTEDFTCHTQRVDIHKWPRPLALTRAALSSLEPSKAPSSVPAVTAQPGSWDPSERARPAAAAAQKRLVCKNKWKGCATWRPFPQDSELTQVLLCNKHFQSNFKDISITSLALAPARRYLASSTVHQPAVLGRAGDAGHLCHSMAENQQATEV